MFETIWQNVSGLTLLSVLRDKASKRKLLLLVCACFRRVWTRLATEDRNAVELFEMIADDPAAVRELRTEFAPWRAAYLAIRGLEEDPISEKLGAQLCNRIMTAAHAGHPMDADSVLAEMERLTAGAEVERAAWEAVQVFEVQAQEALIRDIFGNPFRPVTVDPAWLTSTVVALAAQMYESRDFSPMPILADALQDAGCDSDDILDHCRDANATHVRGCWVIDLVLGKE